MKKTITNKTIRCNLADVLRTAISAEFKETYANFFIDTDENQNLLKRHPYYIPVKRCDTKSIVAKVWPQPDSAVICISMPQYKRYSSALENFDELLSNYGEVEGENGCREYVFRTTSGLELDEIVNATTHAVLVILEALNRGVEKKEEPVEVVEEKPAKKKAPAKKKTTAKKTTKKSSKKSA